MTPITTVSGLISLIESGNNQFAARYEPRHVPKEIFVRYVSRIANIDEDTARVFCMTSWGLYQIMGDELAAKGIPCSPVEWCNRDPSIQTAVFNAVLIEKGIDHYTLADLMNPADSTARLKFAAAYNGPGHPDAYANAMLIAYRESLRHG